ncbi:kinase-like domain-containing protein [Podospora conica]|nr:kinase-like domain-containing protein [Schizothecium conicum]
MSRFFRTSEDSSSSSGSSSEESSHVAAGKGKGKKPLAEKSGNIVHPAGSHGEPATVADSTGHLEEGHSENSHDTVSAGSSISIPYQTATRKGVALSENASQHQGILLAALLEDHYRTRAAEFLNSTDPTGNHTKDSPEVLALAKRLFDQASGTLASAGILNVPASSDQLRDTRAQYLAGLDQLGAGASPTSLLAAVRQLNIATPSPIPEMLVMTQTTPRSRSHYQASFREICLLGRGGFGSVFKCHNLLDQKTYAVKKIPLSPQLSRSFQEGKHDELRHVLVEVQTLASLDHANIVRYHATWVEEPQVLDHLDVHDPAKTTRPRPLLLENTVDADSWPSFSGHQHPSQQQSFGFVFAEDSKSASAPQEPKLLTRGNQSDASVAADSEPSADASDIFTDGTRSLVPMVADKSGPKPAPSTTHELYIQMSLYPMTLHHYLVGAPAQQPAGSQSHLRHCFHVRPSVHIVLAILSGLSYLWDKGLVHRDVKPRNLFLSEPEHKPSTGYCDVSCHCLDGDERPRWLNLRIGDFGLVTQLAHGDLPTGRGGKVGGGTVGTPLYRPPACAWDGGSDPDDAGGQAEEDEKADIFALGVVFVELLCPFSTAMERADTLSGLQKGKTPVCLRERLEGEGCCSGVCDRLLEVVAGMTDPDPRSRWTGEKVAKVLGEINDDIPP